MQVACNRLDRQFYCYQQEYEAAALRVLRSGWYVLGKEVEAFEAEFANFTGSPFCVGLNSGLDALILAFRSLEIGPGDEVICPANTYIASILGVTENAAVPVLVEPDCFYNLDPIRLEAAITPKTRAILAVHLYGQACRMKEICAIAKKHKLFLIEDCAQSHGVCFDGQMTGTFGDIGCFSFYPTKNIGAFGDAGAVVTRTPELAEKLRMLRNYGSRIKYVNELQGVNSRLDEMQAALLRVKLKHFYALEEERQNLAKRYLNELDNPEILLPKTATDCGHGFHFFVVRCKQRDKLAAFLLERGVQTMVNYPIPPHKAACYAGEVFAGQTLPITEDYADTCLSLPLYNGMTRAEQDYVIEQINDWSI